MIRNADDKIHGIKLTWVSEEACVGGATNSTNSFTAKVLCDATNKIDGEAEILAVDVSNTCNPVVTLQHDSGCPDIMDDGNARSMRLLRLAVPILAILLVIGLCGFMCCCYCKGRKARQARKEQELKQGVTTDMPIQAQHDANNIQ